LFLVGFLKISLKTVYPTIGIDGKRYEKIGIDAERWEKMQEGGDRRPPIRERRFSYVANARVLLNRMFPYLRE